MMKQKNKNIFLTFKKLNKKGLILARPLTRRSLWFGAFLFFIILGLFLPINKALADWWNPFTWGSDIAAALGSAVLKIVGLFFFGIPLFMSAIFASIMSLILGWIISPDFISLKFTQNPFVDIGLSITRNFANMGFIIFLVAIALATALRIREYKAKKTLPTLIFIALLINFSPVFCGVIIDAANVVMNFFLQGITGLTGFVNFLTTTTKGLYNLLIGSGLDFWENMASFIQILVMIVFNFFAGFIFILFSALFIMRYIMLWILVILSPIAFVSYILPITRRGRSLLSWREWWKQLIAWSIIGIIAAFFLYLGFTMISMINADPSTVVTYPNLSGLGLMNNILPYLIPLVLLWIGYRETKRTSAMFAKEIVEAPERITRAVTQAAITAGIAAATAGVGVAAGGAVGKLGKVVGTVGKRMGKVGEGLKEYGKGHPGTIRGTLATRTGKVIGGVGTAATYPAGWARRRAEATREWAEKRHPRIGKVAKYTKAAGAGLKEILWEKTEEFEQEREGRKLTDREIDMGYFKLEPMKEEEKKELERLLKSPRELSDLARRQKEYQTGFKLRRLTEAEMKKGREIIKEKVRRKREGIIKASLKAGIKAGLEQAEKEILKPLRAKAKKKKPKPKGKLKELMEEAKFEEEEAEYEEE